MDTRQLAAFCAVVERKSFSQAAERLGVTQPAVSLQVRSLEQRLGKRLLDRSGRRVEPTESGLRLYRNAQRMLALQEQVLELSRRRRNRHVRPSFPVAAEKESSHRVAYCQAAAAMRAAASPRRCRGRGRGDGI